MQKKLRKISIKKALTVGSLALILGVGSIGFAKADNGNFSSPAGHQSGQGNPQDPGNSYQGNSQPGNGNPFSDSQSGQGDRNNGGNNNKPDNKGGKNNKHRKHHKHGKRNYKQVTVSGSITFLDPSSKKIKIDAGSRTYSVNASSATLTNKNGVGIDFVDMNLGNKVLVQGTKNGKSIRATSVSDQDI